MLGEKPSVHHAQLPEYDESLLVDDEVEYPLCINGRKRAAAKFPADLDQKTLEEKARQVPDPQKWLDGKNVGKVIIVPGRMINFVVKYKSKSCIINHYAFSFFSTWSSCQ